MFILKSLLLFGCSAAFIFGTACGDDSTDVSSPPTNTDELTLDTCSATVAEAAFCIVAAPAQNGLYPQGHRERRDFHDRGGCGTVGSFWRKAAASD